MHMKICGRVKISGGQRSFDRAQLIVRLEKILAEDAPSETVSEYRRSGIAHEKGKPAEFEFCLHMGKTDSTARYNINAHVDVDGDEKISRGDLVSTQSYPIMTDEKRPYIVEVKEID